MEIFIAGQQINWAATPRQFPFCFYDRSKFPVRTFPTSSTDQFQLESVSVRHHHLVITEWMVHKTNPQRAKTSSPSRDIWEHFLLAFLGPELYAALIICIDGIKWICNRCRNSKNNLRKRAVPPRQIELLRKWNHSRFLQFFVSNGFCSVFSRRG